MTPKGAGSQYVHMDGYERVCRAEGKGYVQSFYLNAIVPTRGDIPTRFLRDDGLGARRLQSGRACQEGEFRIFDGGAWHCGGTNEGVGWAFKAFFGLVAEELEGVNDIPVFREGVGKGAADALKRVVLHGSLMLPPSTD